MRRPTITKGGWPGGVVPNIVDYDAARAAFSWEAARAALDGLPGHAGLNIAHEAVDRHAAGPRRDEVALRWRQRGAPVVEVTYGQLQRSTSRFANVLRGLDIGRGDRVFSLLGRTPDLFTTALGTLKNASVFSPLFTSFGPEPIHQRLERGGARALVTTPALYRRKVAPIRDALPELEHVLLVGPGAGDGVDCTLDLAESLAGAAEDFEIPPTDPSEPALLHFTSGTTGMPKGAVHVHEAVVAQHATAWAALDLHPDDVVWCTADPGWVTGTVYGVIAPLTHGVTCVVDEGEFDADRWYDVLEEEHVTVWYTAPTALRMLMRAGADVAHGHDLSGLRFVASVGEPLHADEVTWGQTSLGLPVHDNWWQTETGGIMIANLAGTEVRPGSMGRPLPGVEVAVLARGDDGRAAVDERGSVREVDAADVDGELALRVGWPSMFRGYLGEDERYQRCFADGWYLTGDIVRQDEDGWIWFVARADDVIKSAGHLIGPVEVEGVLMEHPAVVEAGVIGVPDPVAGEVVHAHVSLRAGVVPSDDLRLELLALARRRLGPAVAPREVVFDPDLPKTTSGKVMRRELRAREVQRLEHAQAGEAST